MKHQQKHSSRYFVALGLTCLMDVGGGSIPTARAAPIPPPIVCGAVLTQDTQLTADLIDCPGDGLIIGKSNITLDLDGHTVDGITSDDSVGIRNDGFKGVTVEDGVIQEFERGVQLANGAQHNLLTQLTIQHNASDGVALRGVHGNEVRENHTILNGTGIFIEGSQGNRVTENFIDTDQINGIHLSDARGNLIAENTLSGTGSLGGLGVGT